MKSFTFVAAALLAIAAPVMGNVQLTIHALGPTDQNALMQCLTGGSFRTDDWTDARACGGRSFYKNRKGYKSPTDCYDACVNQLASAIQSGASSAICEDYEGHVSCWMGFE
ncbi:hypothetical protein K474DRAFT_1680569 [Panus rudis PR-1116 ss-1]|nr:hypothetical protein K474DRAFT_1680569 [Panus rudis PR-1116 ss-1]